MKISALLSRAIATIHRELSIYWVARAPGVLKFLEPKRCDRVLDVGCGAGLWILALAPRVRWMTGVDICEARVWEAKNRAEQQGLGNVAFVVASATTLPFTDGCFEKAICVDVLDNIPDDQQAVQEIARVTRPGGSLVTTVLLKGRRHYFRPLRFPEHIRNYSTESLSELLTAANFQITNTFYFYHAFSTLLWELATILHDYDVSRWPGLGFVSGAILSGLARLDVGFSRPGAGVGIWAIKPGREQ